MKFKRPVGIQLAKAIRLRLYRMVVMLCFLVAVKPCKRNQAALGRFMINFGTSIYLSFSIAGLKVKRSFSFGLMSKTLLVVDYSFNWLSVIVIDM